MRCISPLLVRTSNRREFVPCGKCNFCLQVKRGDWTFRLLQEQKDCCSSYFLTLTYEDDALPFSMEGEATLRKQDLQLFGKRLRKVQSKVTDVRLRYYSVGEYGTETSRPHYHSIMFNLERSVLARLSDIWSHGMVHVGEVERASIHYVTKYVINRPGEYGGREPPFAFMSKRPGIGYRYLETHKDWHRSEMRNYTMVNGQVGRLPRYFKEKMFTELERRKLALESVAIADEAYSSDVAWLSRFHDDPYYYYDERIAHSHDAVISKVNSLNKF